MGGGRDANPTIRVVLAASDPAVRRSLARDLAEEGVVVCAAEDAADAVIEAALANAPDACVVTTGLRGSALRAAAKIAATAPRTRVVVVAEPGEDDDCLNYLLAGASGYVEPHSAGASVGSAVRSVVAGLSFIPPAAQSRLLDELRA